jgi:hypothetical protein
VEIVRQGVAYVTEGGSFTLTTGVVGREPIQTGVRPLANGAEYFGRPRPSGFLAVASMQISPTVPGSTAYHDDFPGFQVGGDRGRGLCRSIEGAQTGRIYIVD